MMDITISEETLNRTTRCKKDFSCLSPETRDCCKVTDSPTPDIIFTGCWKRDDCPYCLRFGGAESVCECPVRIEIYNKHET